MAEIGSLQQQLVRLLHSTSDIMRQIEALEEVFILNKGLPVQYQDEIITEVIHFSQHHSIQVKKLVYLYLSLIAACHPEVVLHATNSISNDLNHPNPLVRGATLRLITDIPVASESCSELVKAAIHEGLNDDNGYVRSIAVDGVAKSQLDFDNHLSMMLQSDKDPSVVVRCLVSKPCKDVQETVVSLLERIHLMDDTLKVDVITRASKEKFELEENHIYDLLNALEPIKGCLGNVTLSVEASALMLKLSSNIYEVQNDIVQQTVSALLSLLRFGNQNWKYLALCSLHVIVTSHTQVVRLLQENVNIFYILIGDSVHVKLKKIEILIHIVSKSSANLLLKNILHHLHNSQVVKDGASKFLCRLHYFIPEKCKKVLKDLLLSNHAKVVELSVMTLSKLSMRLKDVQEFVGILVMNLLGAYEKCVSIQSQCCCIHLLSFCSDIKFCEMLSCVLQKEIMLVGVSNSSHEQELFTCIFRLFFKWPHLFDDLLKDLFCKLMDLPDQSETKQQAKLYYALLNSNMSFITKLLGNEVQFSEFEPKVLQKICYNFTSVKKILAQD